MTITDQTRYKLWASGAIVAYAPAYSDGSQLKNCQRSTKYQYSISKMRVQSMCCALWRQKRGKVLYFWTITTPANIPERLLAKCFNRFLTILRNKNKINHYVWIKEPQQNGNLHYHILTDKKINILDTQKTWEYCVQVYAGITHITHNSVRLGNRPVVYSVQSVRYYLSKYASKDKSCYESKAYAGSQGLITDTEIELADIRYLNQYCKFSKLVSDDFFNIYVMDSGQFCRVFELFEKKRPPLTVSIPIQIQRTEQQLSFAL